MVLLPAALSAAMSAQSLSPAAETYGFNGAQLGMTLDAWRANAPASASLACGPSGSDGTTITCTADAVPLGNGYFARDIRYTFIRGRLIHLGFETSINGFDHVTAALKRRFGDPSTIVRDDVKLSHGAVLPHVLLTWRNSRSAIRLSDPEAGGDILTVRMDLDDGPTKALLGQKEAPSPL